MKALKVVFLVITLSLGNSSLRAGDASIPPTAEALKQKIPDWCKSLSKELMSVKYDACSGYPWLVQESSVQGHPLPYMFWGAESGDAVQRILVVSAIHGDEISSISIVFRWLDFMARQKPDSELRKSRFLLLPLVNPDGFFARPRTRTNHEGVDLNRNFDTKNWGKEALSNWHRKANKDPRRFPGKNPASEPETKFVQKWVDEFKPELIISIHAPYGLVDHDGPITFPVGMKSPLPLKTLGAFPGSLGQYAGVERKIPVVTVELEAAKKIPEIKSIEDILSFILKANF